MNDWFTLQKALATATNADPLLCLAHAASWLDPLWRDDEDEWDLPGDEDGTLYSALRTLRRAFPDIYCDSLLALRRGVSYAELDSLICQAVQGQGIPLENLEWLPFGIPLPAYGVVLDDPDFYTTYPDVIPVLQCFGITPEPNPYHITVPDYAYIAGKLIATDLHDHTDVRWRHIAWLLGWLFSCTGNSAVDFDVEMMESMQPLAWDTDDIAFAREIIDEADSIMADVATSLAWVGQQPTVLDALTTNIRKVYRKKGKNHARYRFEWPCLAHGAE
ncbi:MAG: hypothetical protein K8I60_14630 [Anaerolineae bacterium]|nr:hypothetical protein [Anaerolineae bacterium]